MNFWQREGKKAVYGMREVAGLEAGSLWQKRDGWGWINKNYTERCPFKTVDLPLLLHVLHVSSKFQAKKSNTIFCLRITCKLSMQDWGAFSNGSRQIGRYCSSFCQIQNIPQCLHFCLVYLTLNQFQINWNWQLHTCTVHLRLTGVLANQPRGLKYVSLINFSGKMSKSLTQLCNAHL